jgi:predicted nucleic acid-binding protein
MQGLQRSFSMKLVVDANILFSALIKNSITTEIIFDKRLRLFAPHHMIQELQKYEKFIAQKAKRAESNYISALHSLGEIITLIKGEEVYEYKELAEAICPDKGDVPYFALALKLKCAIWSNDKKLKQQNVVKVYSTEDIMKII